MTIVPLLITACLSMTPVASMELTPYKSDYASLDLRGYVEKGLKIEKDSPFNATELINSLLTFDDFTDTLAKAETKYGQMPEKQSLAFRKEAKSDFNELLTLYTKALGLFSSAFSNSINEDCKTKVKGMNGEYAFMAGKDAAYPHHEPHFMKFQQLTDTLFILRKNCMGIEKPQGFEIIETNLNFKIGVFLDSNGYVPFLISNEKTHTACVHYGTNSFPQKVFTFNHGNLITESGIATSVRHTYLKLLWQNGAHADLPFTAGRITARIPLELENDPLLHTLKKAFGDDLLTGNCFLSVPTTQEEQDIVEILFLENLMEKSKVASQNPSPQFLTWLDSELDSHQELTATESTLKLTAIHQALEDIMIATIEADLDAQPILETENKVSVPQQNETAKKAKVKTKGKANKKGKGKGKGKGKAKTTAKQAPKKTTQSEAKAPNNHARAKAIYEKVKQEGRIKFRNILSIINTIKSEVGDELFKKYINVNTTGSHSNFHILEGKGTTVVAKHGKLDLSIPAKTANNMSLKLINALFSTALSEK